MAVFFVFACPQCSRNHQLHVNYLGQLIRCVQCGTQAVARDAENESLALDDPMKTHALLSDVSESHALLRRPR